MASRIIQGLGILALASCAASCQSVYYSAMEKFGVEKREILVDRVEEARDDQQEAKEQFQTALEQFKAVTAFQGGDLEQMYDRLNREYERSEARTNDVHNSINEVQDVANALFREWEGELEDYTNEELRRDSAMKLQITRDRHAKLMDVMRRAEASIDPVLAVFRDQVLYLKHNLNAQAIASLQTQVNRVESDVADLLRDMERSIFEANAFISEMGIQAG